MSSLLHISGIYDINNLRTLTKSVLWYPRIFVKVQPDSWLVVQSCHVNVYTSTYLANVIAFVSPNK